MPAGKVGTARQLIGQVPWSSPSGSLRCPRGIALQSRLYGTPIELLTGWAQCQSSAWTGVGRDSVHTAYVR